VVKIECWKGCRLRKQGFEHEYYKQLSFVNKERANTWSPSPTYVIEKYLFKSIPFSPFLILGGAPSLIQKAGTIFGYISEYTASKRSTKGKRQLKHASH
jgi:hypothetical protein